MTDEQRLSRPRLLQRRHQGEGRQVCAIRCSESSRSKAGALSDEPRGPHPVSQFNVIFETPEFEKIVPWLMLNRDGLDILVHPLTDSSYNDHTAFAMWLGSPVALKTDMLRHAPVRRRT